MSEKRDQFDEQASALGADLYHVTWPSNFWTRTVGAALRAAHAEGVAATLARIAEATGAATTDLDRLCLVLAARQEHHAREIAGAEESIRVLTRQRDGARSERDTCLGCGMRRAAVASADTVSK